MKLRELGKTGLKVAPVGLGTAEIGVMPTADAQCERLLQGALDAGVNLIDTGECYGLAEERIGNVLARRREEFVLVTKCGHPAEAGDPPAWSPELLEVNIQRSLRRLRCEYVDVLLLHSCEPEVLRWSAIVPTLREIKRRGLARFIGFSGDAAKADAALEFDAFDVLEISVNICDQRALEQQLPRAMALGLGVLAKRPLANTCWRDKAQLEGYAAEYAQPYVRRLQRMGFTPESLGFDGDWLELTIRFSTHAPGVSTAICGTRQLAHLTQALELAQRGPLPEGVLARIHEAWQAAADKTWEGQN